MADWSTDDYMECLLERFSVLRQTITLSEWRLLNRRSSQSSVDNLNSNVEINDND